MLRRKDVRLGSDLCARQSLDKADSFSMLGRSACVGGKPEQNSISIRPKAPAVTRSLQGKLIVQLRNQIYQINEEEITHDRP